MTKNKRFMEIIIDSEVSKKSHVRFRRDSLSSQWRPAFWNYKGPDGHINPEYQDDDIFDNSKWRENNFSPIIEVSISRCKVRLYFSAKNFLELSGRQRKISMSGKRVIKMHIYK